MQNKHLFVLLCLLLPVLAISQNAKEKMTTRGNRFVKYTNKPGAKAQFGSSLTINVWTFVNDSLVQSTTRDMGGAQQLTMPGSDTEEPMFPVVFDALLNMAEGDSATIYQKVDSALAAVIPPSFGKVDYIRYNIVLVDLLTPEEVKAKADAAEKKQAEMEKQAEATKTRFPAVQKEVTETVQQFTTGKLDKKITKTASGLKVYFANKATGAPIKKGEAIDVHYYGALNDGKMFDSSFESGSPLPMMAGSGQVIPGFDEGIMMLSHGSKAYFFIPSALGYGESGAGEQIPPNADLVFYIEIQ